MAMWWEVFFYVYIESVAHSNHVGIIRSGNLYMGHSFPSSIPFLTALINIIIQGKTMENPKILTSLPWCSFSVQLWQCHYLKSPTLTRESVRRNFSHSKAFEMEQGIESTGAVLRGSGKKWNWQSQLESMSWHEFCQEGIPTFIFVVSLLIAKPELCLDVIKWGKWDASQ